MIFLYPQSHFRGIWHTINVVVDLPFVWDCHIRRIVVPLQFFTFWGLDAIKRKQGRSFTGGNWLTKIFGFMMGGLKVTPTSRFNFLGIGPKIFRGLMKKNNVATLEELLEAAKVLGINMYACEMAMHVLGLKKDDFIPEVKDVLGVASFLNLSEGGQTLFI